MTAHLLAFQLLAAIDAGRLRLEKVIPGVDEPTRHWLIAATSALQRLDAAFRGAPVRQAAALHPRGESSRAWTALELTCAEGESPEELGVVVSLGDDGWLEVVVAGVAAGGYVAAALIEHEGAVPSAESMRSEPSYQLGANTALVCPDAADAKSLLVSRRLFVALFDAGEHMIASLIGSTTSS